MKKSTVFGITVGILSFAVVNLLKLKMDSVAYWVVSMLVMVAVMALYFNSKDD